MEKPGKPKVFFVIAAILILMATFALGAFFGYEKRPEVEKVRNIINPEAPPAREVDFGPFWKAWRLIDEKYAAPDGIDHQKMVWGAIQGSLRALDDPYTAFFPPEEKKLFESEIRGNFGGVGMEIGIRKGILTVIAPLKGTPADAAGIKAGDKILKIGDKETIDFTTEEAVRLIRGDKGTVVKLLILSEASDKPREVSVTRDTIRIPTLETDKKEGGVFIIKLYNFSAEAPDQFRSALRQFILSGSDKLLIDLRNNPGGFLEASVDIASWFLDTGEVVVRERFKSGEEQLYRSKGYNPFKKLPLVVLVNKGSASASEILAGALKDHGVAKLVGEKTFGKGSVQEVLSVTDDTSLKVTIARWLTPNGQDISKNGLAPDIEIKVSEDDATKGKDLQLERAFEILKNWPR
ncbi:MAG: S41 family peptidase [bacterium]|nr:S41 family peptidase [bacterium]